MGLWCTRIILDILICHGHNYNCSPDNQKLYYYRGNYSKAVDRSLPMYVPLTPCLHISRCFQEDVQTKACTNGESLRETGKDVFSHTCTVERVTILCYPPSPAT